MGPGGVQSSPKVVFWTWGAELLWTKPYRGSVFFAYTWVDYEAMKPGTFQIIPREDRIADWKRDYDQTAEMFFQTPPAFAKVLETIAAFERRLNTH